MNTEEKISVLQDVVKIKSENGNEKEVADYYRTLLSRYGIESKLVEHSVGRSNLLAEIKGKNPGKTLIFSGHMDVVEAGDYGEWTYPPYAAEIVDGKLYGRGSTDMKAGLTALILAMIELKEDDNPFNGTIRLVATVGEEIGMLGSEQMTDEEYVDDADGFIIGEPSGAGQIVNSHKGSLQYEIIAKGRSAHSSAPENGIDALQLMNNYINETNQTFEKRLPQAENAQLGQTINVNTVINGGGQINSVAGRVVMKANARTVPEVGNDVVIDIIETAIEKLNKQSAGELQLNILQNNFSVTSEVDNGLVQSIHKAVGENIPVIPLMGATDASNFGRIDKDFDLAIYGPGKFELAHVVNEYVDIDEYLSFITIYSEAAKDYLK